MADGFRGAAGAADRRVAGILGFFSGRGKLALAVTVILSILVTLWLSSLLRVPAIPKHSPSVLNQPSPAVPVLTVVAVIAVCALIGSLFSGRAHFDAGLFAAGIGLTTLSVRGGPMGAALRGAESGPGAYTTLAAEVLVLWGLLMAAWAALRAMRGSATLRDDVLDDMAAVADPSAPAVSPLPDPPGTLRDKLLATTTHAAVMLVLLLLLARGDSKKQMVLAVGITALAGAMISRAFFPVRGSVWFWSAPLLVGLLGYARAATSPGGWEIGVPAGALSGPVPLDYAGVGVAGALMGYWTSRRWQRDREYQAAEAKATGTGAGPASTTKTA